MPHDMDKVIAFGKIKSSKTIDSQHFSFPNSHLPNGYKMSI